jgi:hypothetical protein
MWRISHAKVEVCFRLGAIFVIVSTIEFRSTPICGRIISRHPQPALRRDASSGIFYAYVQNDPLNAVNPLGLDPNWLRYTHVLEQNLITLSPVEAEAAVGGGLWPKPWAPTRDFHGPAFGSQNPLTSFARGALDVPGAGSSVARAGAATIGAISTFVGHYNIGVAVGGFIYAIPENVTYSRRSMSALDGRTASTGD